MNLKEKLQLGHRIYGTAIISPSPLWVGVARQANLDFVFLDTEHIPLGRETIANMCAFYSASGIPTMVRIAYPDPNLACTTLDGGASAILAPYVESSEQVKNLVGAVKYRPLKGEKLQHILNGDEMLDKKLENYITNRCKNNLLFINIESQTAIDHLQKILSVSGLDGVIIGPHDLSCSIGHPEEYTHPVFVKRVKQIIHECNKRNIGVGIHLPEEPVHQVRWAKEGINIILHSSDLTLFGKKLRDDISSIKSELNDNFTVSGNDTVTI